MGEIADMMLDGTLCEMCGVYLEDGGDGIPNYCSKSCARDGKDYWWIKLHPEAPED